MTYKEETYVLDTLKEIQETIRSPEFKQLIKENHENKIICIVKSNLLKQKVAFFHFLKNHNNHPLLSHFKKSSLYLHSKYIKL